MTSNRDKPALAEVPVAQLTPQSDSPMERCAHKVTLHVGGRRYEMTWFSEFREITKGPAPVIRNAATFSGQTLNGIARRPC